MQAAHTSAPLSAAPVWPQPGSASISEEIATLRLKKIQALFAKIDFIPDRPAISVLDSLCRLHYSQFPVDPSSYKRQVNWIDIRPAASPAGMPKARRIFCVRRPDNTLEALMPVGHVLKNPEMKTGRFAYKVTFSPQDPSQVQLKAAFILTAVYPHSSRTEREKTQKNLLDHEINLRLLLNNFASHFPTLENWGYKQGYHNCAVKENGITTKKKLPCHKVMMEDECLELNLAQYLKKYPHISEKEITSIVIRILEALEKLYQGGSGKGFVHCDVKRENIILKRSDGQWVAYLTDVGLATLIGTAADYYLGTASEWPPEYCEAAIHHADTRYFESFDLWTVGMLAWEMLHQVRTQKQWPEFKKAQYNVAFFRVAPKHFDQTDPSFNLSRAFSLLYSWERYESDRWTQEKAKFLDWLAGRSYTSELLFDWLKKKWREERQKFEASIAQQHPQKLWLQGLLRLDPAQRHSVQTILTQLRDYHASLNEIKAPLPSLVPSTAQPESPSIEAVNKTDAVAMQVLKEADAILCSELHSKLITAPPNDKAAGSWWNWITFGWGKEGNCSIQ